MLPKEYKDLFELIESWGGRVVAVDGRRRFRDFNMDECPFDSHCGIDWEDKIFYYDFTHLPNIGSCIHETAHIFASNKEPYRSTEIDFFAFEWQLAHQLGLVKEWEKSSNDYGLGGVSDYGIVDENLSFWLDYGELQKTHKREFWFKLCYKAHRNGLIRNGRVVPLR